MHEIKFITGGGGTTTFYIKERYSSFRGNSTDGSRRRRKADIAEDPYSEINDGDKLVFPNWPYFACSDELHSHFFAWLIYFVIHMLSDSGEMWSKEYE